MNQVIARRTRTIPHELGHFITNASFSKTLKDFAGLDISFDGGRCFTDYEPFKDGRFSKHQEACVLYGGAIGEKVYLKKKNVILYKSTNEHSDKNRLEALNLSKKELELCKKETEHLIKENEELLRFLTRKIQRAIFGKEMIRITPEMMKEFLLQFYEGKDSSLFDNFEITPSSEIELRPIEEIEKEQKDKFREELLKGNGKEGEEWLPF